MLNYIWFRRLSRCLLLLVVLVLGLSRAWADDINLSLNVSDTVLIVNGQTSPLAFVTIAEGSTIMGTVTAGNDGRFSDTFTAQTPGIRSISIHAQDSASRITDTVTKSVNVTQQATTTLSVFLPPTLALATSSIVQGQTLNIDGETFPNSTVTLVVDNSTSFVAGSGANGQWSYGLDTTTLAGGGHNVFARTTDTSSNQSDPTSQRSFTVVVPPPAPVITSPRDGDVVTTGTVMVTGTALANTQIELFDNTTMIGSVFADGSGAWQIDVTLIKASYAFKARACQGTLCGAFSATVNITKQPPAPSFGVTLSQAAFNITAGDSISLTMNFSGGPAPFSGTVDWGDGKTDNFNSFSGSLTLKHNYDSSRQYNGSVQAKDGNGDNAVAAFSVGVKAKPAANGGGFIGNVIKQVGQAISGILAPVGESVGGIIGAVGKQGTEIIRRTPPPVAYSFPYGLFVVILILIILLARQTRQELERIRELVEVLKREKTLAEEKDNFLRLGAHYLRTPTTIITGGVSLIQHASSISTGLIGAVADIANLIAAKVNQLIKDVAQNTFLSGIVSPDIKTETLKAFLSPAFWLPIVLVAGASILANYLFVHVANIQVSLVNWLIEGLAFVIVVFMFYNFYRRRHIQRQNRQNFEQALAHEQVLDAARNDFITQTKANLEADVDRLRLSLADASPKDIRYIEQGLTSLEGILAKFDILTQIKSGKLERTRNNIDLDTEIRRITDTEVAAIAEKNLRVEFVGDALTMIQDQDKLGFALVTVLDNAIKFNRPGGLVKITRSRVGTNVVVTVEDAGVGISEEGVAHLFKPFSRTASALDFNYEGLGFSLYLSKIMMNYVGGDIEVQSVANQGTKVTITVVDLGSEVQVGRQGASQTQKQRHNLY